MGPSIAPVSGSTRPARPTVASTRLSPISRRRSVTSASRARISSRPSPSSRRRSRIEGILPGASILASRIERRASEIERILRRTSIPRPISARRGRRTRTSASSTSTRRSMHEVIDDRTPRRASLPSIPGRLRRRTAGLLEPGRRLAEPRGWSSGEGESFPLTGSRRTSRRGSGIAIIATMLEEIAGRLEVGETMIEVFVRPRTSWRR